MTHTTVATYGDIAHVALNARGADVQEVDRATGLSVLAAMRYSAEVSDEVNVIRDDDGVPFCIYGCATNPEDASQGVPWMIATDRLKRNRKFFHWVAVNWHHHLLSRYERLANYADADNTQSLRWLASLGYTIDPPVINERGFPIRRFHQCAS